MKFLKKLNQYISIITFCVCFTSCSLPKAIQTPNLKKIPESYNTIVDSTNSATLNWRDFFTDKDLVSLIDTAIVNNQDVMMTLQDIQIAQNKVRFRHGALLPTVRAGTGIGIEKVGTYTSQGAGDASAEITPGEIVPEHLQDYMFGLKASWEVDIWGKLRSSKKAAFAKYLQSIEGKNLVLSNLIAEIANSYYDLLAYDNQLDIIRESIQLQKNQLEIVKIQKNAAVVTELAVIQFEAQVLNSQSMEFEILQNITEVENKINFLLGRFPQKILRNRSMFIVQLPNSIQQGIPSQLLKNRPDIRQAEMELLAAKWDVRAAQLEFYPSLNVSSTLGIQAFKPSYLFKLPESLLYNLLGDLAGPIINRNAITSEFKSANAQQIQSMYEYQKRILNGYVEVTNELSSINNLEKRFNLKNQEVEVLKRSTIIANDLFKSARANYLEVLTTQRDALAAKLELIEVKKNQFVNVTNLYKALGGGWK